MKRRQFIHHSFLATGGILLASSGLAKAGKKTQVAIIRGGSPAGMLDLALEEFGGITQFVKAGQKILVKPTMRWDQSAESGQNTNPDLLAHLVKRCYEAGSKGVYLVDQTTDSWTKCYKNSGIERAVKDAGAKILPGNKEFLYQEVQIPGAKIPKALKIHEIVQEVDLIMNVPAVSVQPGWGYFGAFQNLEGLVWNYASFQEKEKQLALDFLKYKQPSLNIMDAYRVVTPGSVKEYKTLIVSPDIVSAENYTADRIGADPQQLSYLKLASGEGLGRMSQPREAIRTIILKNSQQKK